MAFFPSTNSYNPPTTATPIIRRLGKISYFISPAKEGGYAKGTERRTFSMTASAAHQLWRLYLICTLALSIVAFLPFTVISFSQIAADSWPARNFATGLPSAFL